MTRWGLLLLPSYLVLGLADLESRTAIRLAVAETTVVLVAVFLKVSVA